jgi:hypothetical protein
MTEPPPPRPHGPSPQPCPPYHYGNPPAPPDQQPGPGPYAAADQWAPPVPQYPYPPAPQHGQLRSGDREPMPDNGLILAVLAVLVSCCSGGVFALAPAFVALYQSNKVAALWSAGQHGLAREAAKSSKTWSLVSFGVALVGLCVAAVLAVVLAETGSAS